MDCGVSQMVLGSNDSQINPHRCAKFGRGPTVVGGGYRQTDRHTDKGTLQFYIVDCKFCHNCLH